MLHEFSAFDAAAILIVLAAALGYLNHRWLRLPATVGLTVMGAVASLLVVMIDRAFPQSQLDEQLSAFLSDLDFHKTLMEGMLSFLLFAGAMHVDWSDMRRGRWLIMVFSTVGVLISTVIVGFGFYGIASLLAMNVPLVWCFVFGALISPTDPVAVMAVMRRAAMPDTLRATVAGESLFNDGVGVVVFAIVLSIALGNEPFSLGAAMRDFFREAGGGAVLGLIVGWIAFRAMRSIDDYNIEVIISLAVVMGGYSLAHALQVSGPLAMAVAGLVIGNAGVAYAMSDQTQDYLLKFWALIDEILNAVLFLLIGLEVIAIAGNSSLILGGICAIILVMAARAISVGIPLALMRRLLIWGRWPSQRWCGVACGAAFRSRWLCRCRIAQSAQLSWPRLMRSCFSR